MLILSVCLCGGIVGICVQKMSRNLVISGYIIPNLYLVITLQTLLLVMMEVSVMNLRQFLNGLATKAQDANKSNKLLLSNLMMKINRMMAGCLMIFKRSPKVSKIARPSLITRFKTWKKSKKQSEGLPVAEVWENPPADKLALVRSMVGYSILVRKNEQSLNAESVVIVLIILAMFGLFFRGLDRRIDRANDRAIARATRIAAGGNNYDDGGMAAGFGVTMTPQYTPTPINVVVNVVTATPGIFITPTSAASFTQQTQVPTRQAFEPIQVNWVFSYYNPWLCRDDYAAYSANCHVENLVMNEAGKIVDIKDNTACETTWKDKFMYEFDDDRFRGSVAVPYLPGTLDMIYPCGSVLHVSSPGIIAGDYLVTDICPGCDDFASSKNVLFLDFLARGLPEAVTFWDKVTVDRVTYPN